MRIMVLERVSPVFTISTSVSVPSVPSAPASAASVTTAGPASAGAAAAFALEAVAEVQARFLPPALAPAIHETALRALLVVLCAAAGLSA